LTPTPTTAFVAGRYELRERLGSGAGGEVWSADDPRIGRRVAVKFLRAPDQLNPELRAEWENRFFLEARVAGRLSHPGIVSVYDVGTASDGRPFIVMEVVEGHNLDALRRAEPPPTLEQIVRWTIEVAEALDVAHRSGIVHRDIKPANILIGADGRARITDFGIARVPESELTGDGIFLGSPAFASPEQLRGANVDGRADLFSLGAVLYLLVTGRRPFEGEDIAAIAYAACHVDPARPSSLNPAIGPSMDALVLHALQKDPGRRFQAGHDFADALRTHTVDGSAVERTLKDQPAPVEPTAEARAVSIASAVAVFVVRSARAAGGEARRLNTAFVAWLGRTEPRVRQGIRTLEARVAAAAPGLRDRLARSTGSISNLAPGRSRWWMAAVLIACVSVAVFSGRSFVGGDAPRQGHAWEQLRALVGGKSSRVNVVVEHGLEDGTLELTGDDRVLVSDSLRAPKKELFGVPFLSYRSGTDTSRIRLAPGRHELAVRVTGPDGLELVKSVDVQVAPNSEYDLRISISTWPRKRIGTDWGQVAE